MYRQIPESWRILKALGYKYFGMAIWRFFESIWLQIFFVWRNVRPVYLHVFAFIFLCRFIIFKLADGLKIRDIKCKCESFESRSMVLSTFYKICLQNVETDYFEIFARC